MANILFSSIGRKFTMALSALFLMLFLLQHLIINSLSVVNPILFNEVSHFMGNNALIQFILQPILSFAILYHFIMGFILEIKNRNARGKQSYAINKSNENSSWSSRNMIWSGLVILAFFGLHFYDFWFPELTYKYFCAFPEDPSRYYGELVHKFQNQPIRVGLYIISFILLMMHLLHGFQSAFQSVGFNHRKYSRLIKQLGFAFAILIPLGFISIAIFHFFNH